MESCTSHLYVEKKLHKRHLQHKSSGRSGVHSPTASLAHYISWGHGGNSSSSSSSSGGASEAAVSGPGVQREVADREKDNGRGNAAPSSGDGAAVGLPGASGGALEHALALGLLPRASRSCQKLHSTTACGVLGP
mmetsp:Transcript_90996/g.174481  ORF Transcript_90996/g.174481 Transcript_90996/m.174481 type:complete len:135 (+) Transcript_90996:9-413(+)